MPTRTKRVKWQWKQLCSVTACVWGCLTLRPVTWRVVGIRGCQIAQLLPKVIKHLRGEKKGLRPTGFYFMLYLPVLPVLWAMLSFGIQGWSNPRAIFPSTISPIALIGLLRDVKLGQCTYPGASSQSQKCKRCPKGKIASEVPCSLMNSS